MRHSLPQNSRPHTSCVARQVLFHPRNKRLFDPKLSTNWKGKGLPCTTQNLHENTGFKTHGRFAIIILVHVSEIVTLILVCAETDASHRADSDPPRETLVGSESIRCAAAVFTGYRGSFLFMFDKT